MDYEFSSKEELYERVRPALHSKVGEFQKNGYSYIKELDIWNYLIKSKWSLARNLMLSDVVGDILNVTYEEIDRFIKQRLESINRSQYFDGSLENL